MLKMWLLLIAVWVTKSVGQCTDGAIRLGGNSTNRVTRDLEGTVEVCALGQWGTIAAPDNRYFGIEEATVVCRQLGLSDRGAQAMYYTYAYYWQYTYTAYYGAGSGSVVLTCGLYCSGNETAFSQCSYSSYYSVSCYNNHMYDVGVRCQQVPALALSISIAPNQSTTMYAGMAVAFWCNVGYSTLTGAERFLWRSSCMKDCTVWGQTSQLVTIDSLKPSDSGNYTCTVTRATVSRSASVIINVIVPKLIMSSMPIVVLPIVVYALEEPGYDMINLTCIATKPSGVLPSIVFAWSKCGAPVASDPRVSITSWQVSTITSMSNLLLYRASVQDSSVYECKAMMNFPDLSSVTGNKTFQVSIAAPTSSLFQLQIIGVFRCQNWITNRPEIKLNTISMTLVAAVDNLCSCGFSANRVTKAAFSCFGNTNRVLYRAQLNSTATANSSDLLSYVGQWVTHEDTTLVVAGTRLYLESECPVYIRSFKDDACSTSDMDNVTQSSPTFATPRATTGREPTTACPPSSSTTSQPSKGSGVATIPTGTSEDAIGAESGLSSVVGIILVVVGCLVVIFGVSLSVAALVFSVRAKINTNPVYQVKLKKDWEEKEPFRVDLPDQGQQ